MKQIVISALLTTLAATATAGSLLVSISHAQQGKRFDGIWAKGYYLKLDDQGDQIAGYVDGVQVVSATSGHYRKGMAGLIAPLGEKRISTPYFDNLHISPIDKNA